MVTMKKNIYILFFCHLNIGHGQIFSWQDRHDNFLTGTKSYWCSCCQNNGIPVILNIFDTQSSGRELMQ